MTILIRILRRSPTPFRRHLLAVAPLALLCLAGPAAADVRVETGGGVLVPFQDLHREVYGSSPSVGLGVSAAIGDRGARLFLDVAHVRGEGDEIAPDPTFVGFGKAKYRLWPVTLGARFDLNPRPEQDLRLFVGLGVRTLFTRWEGLGLDKSSPTLGALFEWRPEYRVGDRWTVWARQRFDLLGDVDYGPSAVKLDYSGSTLELGVSFGLDDAPLTPRRTAS